MKPETQRRVKNLCRILKRDAYVNANGEWQIVTYTTRIRGDYIDSLPHFTVGRVKMV